MKLGVQYSIFSGRSESDAAPNTEIEGDCKHGRNVNIKYPSDQAWWNTTLYRLSGDENQTIRQLIAGNRDLPLAAFEALVNDQDSDVLYELSHNPSLPKVAAVKLLRHSQCRDVLDEDFYDGLTGEPDLTPSDLGLILEGASDLGREWAVLHPNADWSTVTEFMQQYSGYFDESLIGKLLNRFPVFENKRVWDELMERLGVIRPLLDCQDTPTELLLQIANDQRRAMDSQGGWDYMHEITEKLFRHPHVSAEVFDLLMKHWVFQEQDYDHDLRCLHLVQDSQNATSAQREEATRLIEMSDQWGPKELED